MSSALKTIRILVDRSRDWGNASNLTVLEPDTIYRTTDNRRPLEKEILRRYHVLAIFSDSLLAYSEEEIDLIRRFVENGGGLLLATNTGRFERDVGEDPATMTANQIGASFGIRFPAPSQAKGETPFDNHLHRGYPREAIRLEPHAIWDVGVKNLDIGYLPLDPYSPVEGPEGSEVLLRHKGTGEPLALAFRFGSGRIVAFGDTTLAGEGGPVCGVLNWLAEDAEPVASDDEVPDELRIEEKTCERDGMTVYYTPFVEDRVDSCLDMARKVREAFGRLFGKELSPPKIVEIVPSCSSRRLHDRSDTDWGLSIGAFPPERKLAFIIARHMGEMFYRDAPGIVRYETLGGDVLRAHLGLKVLRDLGFEEEADAIHGAFMARFREEDPTGTEQDFLLVDEEDEERVPKGLWIWDELERKYGADLVPRLLEKTPKNRWKNVPGMVFTDLDIVVRALSLTVGEDLVPWFREIGTTVHPLPTEEQDTDAFKEAVRAYLDEAFRDAEADVSFRSDAQGSIGHMDWRDKKSPSDAVEKLDAQDPYERCAAALRLVYASDRRAQDVLREIASEGADRGLRAMAALALVRRGDDTAAPLLAELARGQDYRFQLDVGYELERIGHAAAGEFALDALRDTDGAPVGATKVWHRDFLRVFNELEGYGINEIWSHYGTFHFPENTHVSAMYVGWVGTRVSYRRKGLARETMQRVMDHPATRRCSCKRLHTGTENVAHVLYRRCGFVDIRIAREYEKKLEGPERVRPVEGVLVRSYIPGDEPAMAALANECTSKQLHLGRFRAKRPPRNHMVKLAERKRELVGHAAANIDRETAYIEHIYVKKGDDRLQIGGMLLAALHNELMSSEAKRIRWWRAEEEFTDQLLQGLGYSSKTDDGVEMFGLVNLPQLLDEISSLLESRLERSEYKGWTGEIALIGDDHRAGLRIEAGKVHALSEPSDRAHIRLTTDDRTLTEIIVGRRTAFQAYLQLDLSSEPAMNRDLRGLTDALFPRVVPGED